MIRGSKKFGTRPPAAQNGQGLSATWWSATVAYTGAEPRSTAERKALCRLKAATKKGRDCQQPISQRADLLLVYQAGVDLTFAPKLECALLRGLAQRAREVL